MTIEKSENLIENLNYYSNPKKNKLSKLTKPNKLMD